MAFTAVCLRSGSMAASKGTLIAASHKSLFSRKNYLPIVCAFCDDSAKKPNLYDRLGVPSSASRSEIKQAYFDLSLKYHPDRNENCESAATKFREVNEAYEILGNFSLKKKYDKGVPLSSVKAHAAKPHVAHNAKYQSFYDSRTSQSQDFGDGYGSKKERISEEYRKAQEKAEGRRAAEANSFVPNLFVIFIFILLLIHLSKNRKS